MLNDTKSIKYMNIKDGVSVIIITRNRCDELKKTIQYLQEQECNIPYEVLIVDQASTDETQAAFHDLKPPFVYKRLDKNYGVSGGRNRGVKLSSYNNMIFIDDDAHFVEKNALEKIADFMNHSKHNLFAFHILNNEGGLYNWPYGKRKKEHANNDFVCKTFIGCGHAIKREFFELAGGYSDALFFWGEESELVMKSFKYTGMGVQYVGNVQIVHRVNGNGRNTYDAKRFYYQVRNRMYLYKELVPSIAFMYKWYYQIGYLVKAIRNRWVKEYHDGMRDYKTMAIKKCKLTIYQFFQYIKL